MISYDNHAVCLCAEHFTCVVKVLYSLQYTQALAALSVRFSPEERLAWSNTGAAKKVPQITDQKTFSDLLQPIIARMCVRIVS